MFCDKCGTQVAPGERFCPACGNRIEGVSAPAPGAGQWQKPARKPMPVNPMAMGGKVGAATSSLSGGKYNTKVLITSAVMFLATLFPFFKINAGAIGDMVMPYISEYIPGLNNGKANLFGLLKLSKLLDYPELAELGNFSKYRVLIIIVFILVLLAIIASIAAGVLNNRTVLMVAGIVCAVACIAVIAYMIGMANAKGMINGLFADELDDIAGFLTGGKLLKSINGFGGWLFMLSSGVQAFFGLSSAFKK